MGPVDPRMTWEASWGAGLDVVLDAFAREAATLAGARIVDVSGDGGVIALGLVERAGASVAAFHEDGYDVDGLLELARERAHIDALPEGLAYSHRNPTEIPTPAGTFDLALSWGGFQRSRHPVSLLSEVRRVLKPQCPLLLRVDPLLLATGEDEHDPWRADGFTLDELQRTLLAARFIPTRVTVRPQDLRLSPSLLRYPLSRLAVAGAFVVAIPEG